MESHCEATEAAAKVLCYQGSNLLWGQSTEGFHGWSNNTMLGWVRPTLGQRYSHKSTGREVGWVNHRDLTGFILLPASFFGQQWTYCTVSMRYKQQCDKKRQEIKTGRERMVLIDRVWQWLFYFILFFFQFFVKQQGEKINHNSKCIEGLQAENYKHFVNSFCAHFLMYNLSQKLVEHMWKEADKPINCKDVLCRECGFFWIDSFKIQCWRLFLWECRSTQKINWSMQLEKLNGSHSLLWSEIKF